MGSDEVTAGVVLGLGSVVILLGSITEFRDALRRRRDHFTREEAVDRLLDLRPAAILAWVGLAAATVLAPAAWRDSTLPLADAALVAVVLGFAAERASYLLARSSVLDREQRASGVGAVAAGVVLAGLAVGLAA